MDCHTLELVEYRRGRACSTSTATYSRASGRDTSGDGMHSCSKARQHDRNRIIPCVLCSQAPEGGEKGGHPCDAPTRSLRYSFECSPFHLHRGCAALAPAPAPAPVSHFRLLITSSNSSQLTFQSGYGAMSTREGPGRSSARRPMKISLASFLINLSTGVGAVFISACPQHRPHTL